MDCRIILLVMAAHLSGACSPSPQPAVATVGVPAHEPVASTAPVAPASTSAPTTRECPIKQGLACPAQHDPPPSHADVVKAFAGLSGSQGPTKPGKRDPAAQPLTARARAFVELATQFVCFAPDTPDKSSFRYEVARVYFEANHYEEAAGIFREIALAPKVTEEAQYAASLALESLNVLWTRDHDDSCRDAIVDLLPRLIAHLCLPVTTDNRETCNALTSVEDQVDARLNQK